MLDDRLCQNWRAKPDARSMKTSMLAVLILLLLAFHAPCADSIGYWEPPDAISQSGSLFSGGETAEGHFVSSLSFADLWAFYAKKLGIRGARKSGQSGLVTTGVTLSGINYGETPNESASILRRSDALKHQVVTLSRTPGGATIDVFVLVLPRR